MRTCVLLLLAALIGASAGLGRACGSQAWGAWMPGAVQMKEVTGALFVFHAAWLALRMRPGWGVGGYLLLVSVILVGLFVLVGTLRGILTLERLDAHDPRTSLFPSIYTVSLFFLVSLAEVFCLLGIGGLRRVSGSILLAAAALIVTGYASGTPRLYGYLPGFSTAVALPTAVAFGLLGAAMIKLEVSERPHLDAVALIRRIKSEHLCILYPLCWGGWAAYFKSFDHALALNAANQALHFSGVESEYIYAGFLCVGALMQCLGLRLDWMSGRIQGALIHFAVFFSVFTSALVSNPRGTAPVTCLFVALVYLHLAMRLATRPTLRRNLFVASPAGDPE